MHNLQLYNNANMVPDMSNDEKLSHILVKVTNMEASHSTLIREISNISATVRTVNQRVDTMNTCIDAHSRMMKLLTYKSIDNEARCRRNNLIFRGIGENSPKSDVFCVGLIQDFISQELCCDAERVCIDRAHRLGQRGYWVRGTYTRPIIVKFRDYDDVEMMLTQSYRLKGNAVRYTQRFPARDCRSEKTPFTRI